MGVQARAVLVYGVRFDTESEIEQFLSKYDVDDVDEVDSAIDIVYLNKLDGEEPILGYHVDVYTPMSYYEAQWKIVHVVIKS